MRSLLFAVLLPLSAIAQECVQVQHSDTEAAILMSTIHRKSG
jgi:hypothetical protein